MEGTFDIEPEPSGLIFSMDATSVQSSSLSIINKASTGSLVTANANYALTVKSNNGVVFSGGKIVTLTIDPSVTFYNYTIIFLLDYLGGKPENDIVSNMVGVTGSPNAFLLMRFNGTIGASQWQSNGIGRYIVNGAGGYGSLFTGMSFGVVSSTATFSVIQDGSYYAKTTSSSLVPTSIPRTISIGARNSGYSAGYGDFSLLCCEIYNKALTSEELRTAYIRLNARYI